MHIKLIWDDNRYPRPRFGLNRSHQLGGYEARIATGESAEMSKKKISKKKNNGETPRRHADL